ncbi:RND transporter [Caldovatus sediminis]|uniref:RND transporter n=1 Tax=Caldovatus sediminis TaxID=2041189 RepID=A0A8J3ECJ7_9PROT|nr:MMPL family transporter [Caldovatus sediminis]GGG33640.1 RND transporter [Caldovatus sediminis]
MPLAGRIVAASCRRPWRALLLGLLLGAAALLHIGRDFAITTDTAELLSPDLEWRRQRAAFNAAFPRQADTIVAVIDAATPELADEAASALAARLRQDARHVRSVRLPEGGPFFERNGLLLLPLDEVQAATERLIAAQPVLGTLAADPSLRGVMTSLSTALEGVRGGEAALRDLERAMTALAEAFEAAAEGRPAFFSWRRLIADAPAEAGDARRILIVQPVLDYGALAPGAAASGAIRAAARELGLGPAHGVRLRLTGPVPLADEEFATLVDDAALTMGAMVASLLVVLWLAVRSLRYLAAILLTTALGLVVTTGVGLFAVGRLNLISVAFIPLFVGLGVDFGIQLGVRCRAERRALPRIEDALVASGIGLGRPLTLAALAIAAGFFAFLPTRFTGVSELGAIAGLGMLIALAMSLTVLPALLTLLDPPPGRPLEGGGLALAAPVVGWLCRHRRAVLRAGAALAAASIALLPMLRFDSDPLNLRNPEAESMATLADLMADPDRTPHTIDVLAPSLAAADALAGRLAALPEVSRAVTLSSFIPARQEEKLALIEDAAALLALTLDPVEVRAPPSDAEAAEALARTAAELRRTAAAADAPGAAARAARRLADALDRLAEGAPERRQRAAHAVRDPLMTLLRQTRTALEAAPVTRESLPPELVADWVAEDGRARVQVFPREAGGGDAALRRFAAAVQAVAPAATGTPILTREAGDTVVLAFLQAAALSALAIAALLWGALRRGRDVALAMLPVLLAGLLTLATCVVIGQPLNFANVIALPLLIGIGVAFSIYFVLAWRAGETDLVQTSLMRAVVFSALTTATAFGALWLSSHPGTASMGRLLMIALGWELAITILFRPVLLARPRA